MKSLIVGFTLLAIILFTACNIKNTNENSVKIKNVEISSIIEQTTTKSTIEFITECTTEPITESIMTVDEYFYMLPENVQKAFFENGWIYEKSKESLGNKFYNGQKSVSGLTNYREKKIYIDCNDNANKSILHEVGHRFEYESYVQGVYSEEFKSLYEEHWAEWYVNYGEHINNYDTIEEAYAQCYEIYFLAPDCLDKDTYNFIYQELSMI